MHDRQRDGPRAVPRRRAAALVSNARMTPRISVFPKCWFDDFVAGTRDYLAWIREAPSLGGEASSTTTASSARPRRPTSIRGRGARRHGQPTSLVCFSPDFTHPDADERARQVERQRAAIDLDAAARRASLPHAQRTALPGHDAGRGYRADGRGPVAARSSTPTARRGAVHGEPLQGRHLALSRSSRSPRTSSSRSSGASTRPPSACSSIRRTLRSAASIRSRFSRRSSIASSRCTPPIAISRRAPRSRTCAPRTAAPAIRAKLLHGETGQGLNDYDAIFRILAGVGFAGWISIEDGMNGLDEMARSVAFLKQKRAEHFGLRLPLAPESWVGDRGLRPGRRDVRRHSRVEAVSPALGPSAGAARTAPAPRGRRRSACPW